MSTPTEIKDPATEPAELEKVLVPDKNEVKKPDHHEHDFHVACGGGCPMTPPGN